MTTNKINNRKDILLLLLYAPGITGIPNEPIIGRTRLIKLIFLFKQEVLQHFKKGTEIDEAKFYEFFPWDFGPFSSQVYEDLTFFELRNFVKRKKTNEDVLPEELEEWDHFQENNDITETSVTNSDDQDNMPSEQEYVAEEFFLTDRGVKFVEENLCSSLTKQQMFILTQFKSKLSNVPLRALLKYVYTTYKSMTTNSIIKDDILDF